MSNPISLICANLVPLFPVPTPTPTLTPTPKPTRTPTPTPTVTVTPTPVPVTCVLSASKTTMDEGDSVTFKLTTTGIPNGTNIPYTLTGISAEDISGGNLTGNFVVNNGVAYVNITVVQDLTTEGIEKMTMTACSKSVDVNINDTSTAAYICYQNYEFSRIGETSGTHSKDTGFLTAADLIARGTRLLIMTGRVTDRNCRKGNINQSYYSQTIATPGAATITTDYTGYDINNCAVALRVDKGKLYILHSYDAPVSYFENLVLDRGASTIGGCDIIIDESQINFSKFIEVYAARIYIWINHNKGGPCYGGLGSQMGRIEFV